MNARFLNTVSKMCFFNFFLKKIILPLAIFLKLSLRSKHSTWGLKLQDWNSKELAGIYASGGACGLMR